MAWYCWTKFWVVARKLEAGVDYRNDLAVDIAIIGSQPRFGLCSVEGADVDFRIGDGVVEARGSMVPEECRGIVGTYDCATVTKPLQVGVTSPGPSENATSIVVVGWVLECVPSVGCRVDVASTWP